MPRSGWSGGCGQLGEYLYWVVGVWWLVAVLVNGATFLIPISRKTAAYTGHRPGVSVLVPVKGLDSELADNLDRLCRQAYPNFEILFLVADPLDPAAALIKDTIKRHPAVPARLLIGDGRLTPNPKVNNLVKGVGAARHDLLLMCDANVAVEPGLIEGMLAVLTPGVGVVWAVPIAVRPENFVGELECAMFNGFSARWLLAAKTFGTPVCVGKTTLLRKRDIERIGGIASTAAGLCEDSVLGEAMRALGLTIAVADEVVAHPVGRRTFREFWDRHLRWHCCRRCHRPGAFLAQPFLGAAGTTLAGAFFWTHATGVDTVAAVLVSVGAWLLIEGVYLWRLGWPLSGRGSGAWLVRELLLPALWVQAAMTQSINWRGTRMPVSTGITHRSGTQAAGCGGGQ
jgi:ceramide glucosyltransferase